MFCLLHLYESIELLFGTSESTGVVSWGVPVLRGVFSFRVVREVLGRMLVQLMVMSLEEKVVINFRNVILGPLNLNIHSLSEALAIIHDSKTVSSILAEGTP